MRDLHRSEAGSAAGRASRILPVLVLLASVLLPPGEARSATDAPTAFRLLADLNPGPGSSYPPNNAEGDFEPGAHSGDTYFMPVQTLAGDPPDFELIELYVTSGRSEDGHILDGFEIPSQIALRTGYGAGITPFGEGHVLFLGRNGSEDDLKLPTDPDVALGPVVCPDPEAICPERYDPLEMRLFVTDGEQTELLAPGGDAFPCLNDACGFYRVSAGDDYRPEPPIAVTDVGVAFIGAWFDGTTLGTRVPYLIEGDASGYSVAAIDPASGLTGGNSADGCCQLGIRAGQRIVAIGSVVFADLTDCAPSGCIAGDDGRELYAADLSAADPTWRIASTVASGSTGTSFPGFPVDVVGDRLYFAIGGGSEVRGTYVGTYDDQSGLTTTKIGAQWLGGSYGHAAVGSDFYYWARFPNNTDRSIMRSIDGASASPLVTFTANTIGGAPGKIWSTGDAIYFVGAPSPSATPDGIYRFEPGRDVAPVRIFATPDQPGEGLFGGAYDGNLFFTAGDPSPGGEPKQLFAYSGSGTPTMVTRINGSAAAGFRWFGRVDDLFVFWAEDGVHGYEPWVVDVLEATLTVAAVGSGTVTSDPPGIECPPTCTHPFRFGTAVTLDAIGDGVTFARWTSNCTSGADPAECTVVLDGPKAVAAVFTGVSGDVLAISATGPDEVPDTGSVEYTIVVGNLTGTTVGPLTLTGDLGSATLDTARTPSCGATETGFTCGIAALPPTTAQVLKVFADAAPGGFVEASFDIGGVVETETDNNVASVTTGELVVLATAFGFRSADTSAGIAEFGPTDRFSLSVASYPGQTTAGRVLPYSLDVRNIGATASATLHVGFAGAQLQGISAAGLTCQPDAEAAPGFLISASCSLGSVPGGGGSSVTLSATAPAVAGAEIGVSAAFWVTYAGGPDADPSNDRSESLGTTIAPGTSDVKHSAQVPLPLPGRLRYTSLAAGGATPLDPSGSVVALERGFAGYLLTREMTEEPSEATPGPSPAAFICSEDPTYLAACLAFDVVVEQFVSPLRVFTITFTFDASTLVNTATRRPLLARSASLFVSTDGGETYEVVPACPSRSSASTYTGTVPCVVGKTTARTRDGSFTVLTSTGGLWKIGT